MGGGRIRSRVPVALPGEDCKKSWGTWFVIFAVGSFVLNLLGLEFAVLSWVDTWGPAIGTAIRIGLIVVGAAMWLIGTRRESAPSAA